MQSRAATVQEYLDSLPDGRQEAIAAVRDVILVNLPDGYEEVMQYGMISYVIPLDDYPDTYNDQPLAVVSLASQKNHMALYLMCVYGDEESRFRERYEATGKRLDMGKSCVRFRSLDDLPLDLIGEEVAVAPPEAFIAAYEASRERA